MAVNSPEKTFDKSSGAGLPRHLERYAVEQDYERYTSVDQAAWRYIMRQLKSFLSDHAHPCYIDGLARTGIDVDSIPRIDVMNEKLDKFGWRAVPVSGFIPPAAFMELQSLGVLPIASDMRSVDHLNYTPAPDIVHEAAGHAPILVDPDFAAYLKAYAQVASKAILSREDMDQYEAIRILSDMKEDPASTTAQIRHSEERLAEVTAAMTDTSEAAILGRMNWWTAEYGMIGDLKNPKIFGAGLLSSIGESRAAVSSSVKKIPLTIDCINYTYDITEQQPQLFVVPTFDRLGGVLEELAARMAFRKGGAESLEKAKRSKTVNTIELDSGLQISGVLKDVRIVSTEPAYLSFDGPTQLSLNGNEIEGQGVNHHQHGFGSPLGRASIEVDGRRSSVYDLAATPSVEIERAGLKSGASIQLNFESGVVVTGEVSKTRRAENGQLVLITLNHARAIHGTELLFDPAWGVYDMAVGVQVASAYGGPSDRSRFGSTEDFTKKTIPRRIYEGSTLLKHKLYEEVARLRSIVSKSAEFPMVMTNLKELIARAASTAANDWLLHIDLLEIAEKVKFSHPEKVAAAEAVRELLGHLQTISRQNGSAALHIADARKLLPLS
ncbi:aromatic amino acid hydroxylase [soil metagenome]